MARTRRLQFSNLDPQQWQYRVVDLRFVGLNDETVRYLGEAGWRTAIFRGMQSNFTSRH